MLIIWRFVYSIRGFILRSLYLLKVRNAQLDKEARELRLENENLAESVEYSRAAAANNEEASLSSVLTQLPD